jgi:2-phospho-L-lactate guanylyltransferase
VRTLAILPVKRFELAKQRLSTRLPAAQREIVARAMVEDVLNTLVASSELAGVLVVTNEPSVAALSEALGAIVEPDRAEAGQNAAAGVGIAYAVRAGIERVLLIPGDCHALDGEELSALLAHPVGGARVVVVVPDRHGTGTNALLLSPPDVIAPAFGPDSFARHRELAGKAGALCETARPSTLLLDVDTPEDLAALLAMASERAPRTRAAFATLPIAG